MKSILTVILMTLTALAFASNEHKEVQELAKLCLKQEMHAEMANWMNGFSGSYIQTLGNEVIGKMDINDGTRSTVIHYQMVDGKPILLMISGKDGNSGYQMGGPSYLGPDGKCARYQQ